MYALTASEHQYLDSLGCQEDHDHSWCEQDSYSIEVAPLSLHKERRKFRDGYIEIDPRTHNNIYGCEDVPVGDTAYVVVVTYTDGDTFGYRGYWCVPGLFKTPEAAEDCRKRCENANDTTLSYRPWDGYFSSLRAAEVYPMKVLV